FEMLSVILLASLLLKASLASTAAEASYVTQITEANMHSILHSNEVVFVYFYADWCVFSTRLAPIFEQAAAQLKAEYPEPGKVVLGRVDCGKEQELADRYLINKHPTLHLFRRGRLLRRQYRGARTLLSLVDYVQTQFRSPIINIDDPTLIKCQRRCIFGYFETTKGECPALELYVRLADRFKDDCDFYQRIGKVDEKQPGMPRILPAIVFRPDEELSHKKAERFEGDPSNSTQMKAWILDRCVPLVMELDYWNVEELIEEKLPLLLLFYYPGDPKPAKDFRAIVEEELSELRGVFNFVIVNGLLFDHVVTHMGKTQKDLPFIAVDSLDFMYTFPRFNDIHKKDCLRRFVTKYQSSKDGEKEKEELNAPNPRSTLKELGPSKHRYSLLEHNEL
ncbi:hypothetical protein KR018_001807, partial [Drosophila ironensis]